MWSDIQGIYLLHIFAYDDLVLRYIEYRVRESCKGTVSVLTSVFYNIEKDSEACFCIRGLSSCKSSARVQISIL